ncbi:LysR substrate-binding domain-containing protein, partial [Pseudomonas corrugata]
MKRHFEDLQLGSIELFCLAAEAGSFTAAAQVAGVTPAAVSRSIFRLEERLGSRLFVRTTRSIRLTDAGKTYFEQCRQALTQLVEAQQEMMGAQSMPSGQLRISLPTTYGHHRILPLLPAFRALYPQVSVDVHLSNRNIDFVAEGYDLAIRVRAQPDSSLIARLLEDARLVVVAAPDYLRKAGTPRALEDLDDHECIQFELPSSGRRISWLFNVDGKEREVFGQGNYCCSDDVLGGVTLARHGAGLFQTYRFIVEQELADGSLVEVLQPFSGRSRPFTLLYPHGRYMPQ